MWSPNNLWYPSRVTYRYYEAGSLLEEEVSTIDELVYDQAPADAVFTLAGLEPEQGRAIVMDGTQLMAWNDGKLAPMRGPPPAEPVDVALRGRQRFNWLLVANGVFLLAVAVFLLVRLRGRNSRP